MSSPTSDRSLGPATIISALVLLLGIGAYVVVAGGDDPVGPLPAPSPTELPKGTSTSSDSPQVPSVGSSVAATESEEVPEGPARGALSVPSASALAMAPGPSVTPDTYAPAVLKTLDGLLPKLKACAADWVGRHPDLLGKAFFVFTIDEEGSPVGLTLQYKSVRSDDLDACFTTVLGGADFAGSGPAKVFWPLDVGGNAVVRPVDGRSTP